MTEVDSDATPQTEAVPVPAARVSARQFLWLALGLLVVAVDVRVGTARIDVASDYVGYFIVVPAAWSLRSASRWFGRAAILAGLAFILLIARAFVTTSVAPWLATPRELLALGAAAWALSGATEVAFANEASTLAAHARRVRFWMWMLMAIECSLSVPLPFVSGNVGTALRLVRFAATIASFTASVLVFVALAARIDRDNVGDRANRSSDPQRGDQAP